MLELAASYVPAADEVWRLQRGDDPECLAFQSFADDGHYRGAGGTRQGVYVVTPAGALLGSANTLAADAIIALLERGLAAWDALPEPERRAPADLDVTPAHRWEDSHPEHGLVLTCFQRDLPADGDVAAECGVKWNRDFVWFHADERNALLPARLEVGARHAWPRALALRLAQFHLVDAVVGQSLPFAESEVERAELAVEVVAVEEGRARLRVDGRTAAESDGVWKLPPSDLELHPGYPRGVTTRLLGRLDVDVATRTITDLRIVALGTRWGRTQHNGRAKALEPSPIGFALRLAAPDAPRVAPAFIDVYGADWVERPADG